MLKFSYHSAGNNYLVVNEFQTSSKFIRRGMGIISPPYKFTGYAPQAEEHALQARNIMATGVQLSSSDKERHRILAVLVNLHYILGRAQAQQKKYPFFCFI